MRQRKAKDMEARLASLSDLLVAGPSPDAWDAAFGRAANNDAPRDLYLEIGCGKGQFIIEKAIADPGSDYLAIEGQETVILRALEKTRAATGQPVINDKLAIAETEREIPNLKFACTFGRAAGRPPFSLFTITICPFRWL